MNVPAYRALMFDFRFCLRFSCKFALSVIVLFLRGTGGWGVSWTSPIQSMYKNFTNLSMQGEGVGGTILYPRVGGGVSKEGLGYSPSPPITPPPPTSTACTRGAKNQDPLMFPLFINMFDVNM